MKFSFVLIILSLGFWLVPESLSAHRPDQSYVFLDVYQDSLGVSYEILIKDLNKALDTDLPTRATKGDIEPILSTILDYYNDNVKFSFKGEEYTLDFKDFGFFDISKKDNYLLLNYVINTGRPTPDSIAVYYNVLVEKDPSHSGYVIIRNNWKGGVLNQEANIVQDYQEPGQTKIVSLEKGSVLTGFWMMMKQGMIHIWIGIDHILFLLALTLPAIMTFTLLGHKRAGEGERIEFSRPLSFFNGYATYAKSFKPAFTYVLKIITFFTLAHTITLSLAALQIVNLPGSLVESLIALSIIVAAAHNIYPMFKGSDWLIAFGFGLFHGFGFASVLADLGLRGEYMTYTLLGFNLGVEIGQIGILAILFPILFVLRKAKFYPKLYIGITVFIAFVALLWFLSRAFGLPDIPQIVIRFVLNLVIDG